jgi:hypothetical protein
MKLIFTILNLVLLAGTVLMLLLTILSGSSDHTPLNKFYWLSADTSNIKGAPSESAWTFWGVCEKSNYSECTLGPAYPISPKDNFHTTQGVPSDFVDNRDTYYYLTRFSFSFTIVGICFAGIAFIIGILGLCFTVIDRVSVAFILIALFFIAGMASMQTAAIVLAKNAFNDDNRKAHIGVKLMALMWATVACLIISFFLTCFSNITHSYRKHMDRVYAQKEYNGDNQQSPLVGPEGDESSFTRAAPEPEAKESNGGGVRFFKIMRNTKVSDEESV